MGEDEAQDRTFNEEQSALFEQPDQAGEKTRPRTPGTASVPATVAPDVAEPDAPDEGAGGQDGPLIRRVE